MQPNLLILLHSLQKRRSSVSYLETNLRGIENALGGTVPPIIIVTLRKSGRDDYDEGRLAEARISAALRGASIRLLSSFLTVPAATLRWFYISLLANRVYISSASGLETGARPIRSKILSET